MTGERGGGRLQGAVRRFGGRLQQEWGAGRKRSGRRRSRRVWTGGMGRSGGRGGGNWQHQTGAEGTKKTWD